MNTPKDFPSMTMTNRLSLTAAQFAAAVSENR